MQPLSSISIFQENCQLERFSNLVIEGQITRAMALMLSKALFVFSRCLFSHQLRQARKTVIVADLTGNIVRLLPMDDHAKLKRSTVVFHVTDLYSFRILGRSAPQLKRTSQCSKFKFFRRHLLVTSININWLALQKLILVCKTEMYLNYTLT